MRRPDDKLYANPLLGLQATGGSTSVRAFWLPLRKAGAGARAMLVQAAAQQWQVEPASCTASNGQVIHAASDRKLAYGALAEAAGKLAPPADVPLKDPKNFTLIGKPLKRLDTPDKTNGKVVYGIDAMLPGMKFATLAQCPVFGGKVGKVDDSAARKVPGVQKVVVLDDLVAVVGDHMWAAKKGLDALVVTWNEGPNANLSSKDIWEDLRVASAKDGVVAKSTGDIAKGLATGDRVDASYELPFLAHATMEPLNCTVQFKPDGCEIWTGTQIMARVQSEAAKAAGLPVEKVTVNNHLIGGGFGRRLEPDMVVAAVRIAKEVDGPVKIVWTREEDIQHDIYRPVYRDTISASLSGGKIVGWKYRVAGASIIARWLPPAFQKGIDIDAVDAAVDMPYDIPNFLVEYVRAEPRAVPTGWWRGVGPNNNVFAIEASWTSWRARRARTRSPFVATCSERRLVCRRRSISWSRNPTGARRCPPAPAAACAFNLLSAASSPPSSRPKSTSRARCACVASPRPSIPASPSTPIRSRRSCEGGLIFGLTAALWGEVTIDKGRVQQSNFNNYRMLRIDEVPRIDVHVIKSGEAPGGIGETGTTAGPPALRNAIYAATGVALRRLPIDRDLLAVRKRS